MTARTRAAGVALTLVAPTLAVLGLPLGFTPATASTEQGQACSTDNPQLIDQQSPILQNLAIGQSWRFATGAGTVVAVVDSGVNTGNVHLPAGTAVLPGASFVPGDTGDGRTDASGHGTVVAGIIGARPVDGSGVVGAAPNAKILPVRVYTNDGDNAQETDVPPTGERIAQGIRWAVDNGADVVNVSLSVASTNVDLAAIESAVDLARKRDVVVVASTGNSPTGDSGEPSQEPRYPAAIDGVVGVAATNAQGVVDAYSFQGPQVDLAAPGSSVLVAFQAAGDCQTEAQPFTSWAAPFVSALAAQLRERYPKASAAEIEYLMTSTARRPVTGSRDDTEGWGLIQPYEALTVNVDKRRPGPDAEAVTDEGSRTGQSAKPLGVSTDELAPVRREALWWWIGGAGLAAVGLLLRPLVRRRTTARDAG